MGKICNKLKEPDPWPDQFAESMKGRQENITKKLKEFRLKSTSDEQTFKAAFSPLMKTALAGLADDSATSPSSSAVPIHVPFLGPEGQPYCDGLVNLMRQSDTLTFAYDQLSGRGPQTSRLQDIRTSFEKDKEVAVATLEAGKQVAKIEIERLLADKFQEVRTPHDLTADDMNKGRLLLSRGAVNNTSLKQPLGWGNVARDTERAMENLCCAGQGNGRNH
ncbi:hypothetical protein A1O3_09068 [Capronia epimyces CBS 606.96]|uniref:Uncharacterized protein n=1 Tax=Capronia epimyces CBS 606.96 TaxID=1182542 RepID=W9Y672_9EURO|nr:uncharacterized protein A1O3_09068 [Capronia epimyces CBS 606.96]EXJ77909.1 hypothetical protein A1O3_09068 [Capronia epimyces CBS 606.96]